MTPVCPACAGSGQEAPVASDFGRIYLGACSWCGGRGFREPLAAGGPPPMTPDELREEQEYREWRHQDARAAAEFRELHEHHL